ncbi:MAG TPA: helix-turn-helix transcriptional regulator [Rhizomicrobium sp.]|jgi:DNA-binding CsgD family transcriptional regulator|nr:helix-turn-helix transcriptional regulator [Rhizomicrobium sp.]
MQVPFDAPQDAWLSLAVLNRLQLGIAILDATGSIFFANARSRELLGAADVVAKGAGERLRFVDCVLDRKFRRALGQIASGGAAVENASEVFVVQRPRSAQMPLVIAVCGLALKPTGGSPRLLVTFADAADALSTTNVGRLAEFFRLTPAEQRLTQYLASGGRLSDAAREFGVSPHTVRNQLRAVFEKSGVQRQADLTRLVMTGGTANFPAMHRQLNNTGRESSHAFH